MYINTNFNKNTDGGFKTFRSLCSQNLVISSCMKKVLSANKRLLSIKWIMNICYHGGVDW